MSTRQEINGAAPAAWKYVAGALAAALTAQAQSGVLAEWELSGANAAVSNSLPVASQDADLAASSIVAVGTSAPLNFIDTFCYGSWPAGPLDPAQYLQWTITPAPDFQVSYDSMQLAIASGGAGTVIFSVHGSSDGFASSDLALFAQTFTADATFQIFGGLDISALGVQSGPVTFRLYVYNTNGPGFTGLGDAPAFGGGSNVILKGSVGPAPQPTCPWDCGLPANKVVDVVDLLALLGQYDAQAPINCTGGACDFNGDGCVDVVDLLKLLGQWGQVCPAPSNDQCAARIEIDRLDVNQLVEIPFDLYGATPSPEPSACAPGLHKDIWYCITNNTGQQTFVEVNTTGPVLMQEYSDGCTCPPGPVLACTTDGHGLLLEPGAQVQVRLINHLDLDNALLQGTLVIQSTSNSGACCDPANGSCSVQTLADCALSGGVYAGGSTDCTDTDGDRIPDAFELDNCVSADPCFAGTNPFIADTDGDGLPDGDELYGTLGGVDLPAMGADPLRKDIFIEMDWMDDTLNGPHTHRPTAAAIELITAAFDLADDVLNPCGTTGIALHVDYGQGGVFTGGNLIGDDTVIIFDSELNTYKAAHFDPARHGSFHYNIHAHAYNFIDNGSSGFAELPGDDFVVTLGNALNDDFVAATTMHELGHNLNLRHGGGTDLNWKPNYNSVMNYRYTFTGVDSTCHALGDGILDYSHGLSIVLNENALDEAAGVCGSMPIDWNGNAVIDGGLVARNINCYQETSAICGSDGGVCWDSGCGLLTDFNDWVHLSIPIPPGTDFAQPQIIFCQDTPEE